MKILLALLLFIPSLSYANIISLGCDCQTLETSIMSPDGIKKENKNCNKFIDINVDLDNQTVFTQSSFFTHFEKGKRFDYYEDGYDIRFEKGKNFTFQKDKVHTTAIEYYFILSSSTGGLNIYQQNRVSHIGYGVIYDYNYNFSCKLLDEKDL